MAPGGDVSAPAKCPKPMGSGEDSKFSESPKSIRSGEDNKFAESPKPTIPTQYEDELKRERKRFLNRGSAKRSRTRKEEEWKRLQGEVKELENETSMLVAELRILSKKCFKLEMENVSLLEELKKICEPNVIRSLEAMSIVSVCQSIDGKSNKPNQDRESIDGESNQHNRDHQSIDGECSKRNQDHQPINGERRKKSIISKRI